MPEKRRLHPRKAAGAKITHSQYEEVVTRNDKIYSFGDGSLEWFDFKIIKEFLLFLRKVMSYEFTLNKSECSKQA
uniref:Uncharacterized protein n=1 Tax=Panagrolaimus sp. PS1159 TaxID=55785 RepID=A0AC35FDN3_9BILA